MLMLVMVEHVLLLMSEQWVRVLLLYMLMLLQMMIRVHVVRAVAVVVSDGRRVHDLRRRLVAHLVAASGCSSECTQTRARGA